MKMITILGYFIGEGKFEKKLQEKSSYFRVSAHF